MESVFPSAYLTVVSFCARILTVLNTGDVNVMKRKILIVDDEQSIADLVEVYLSNEGMEVLKCYNGQDALDCIKKEALSLAVLDVMLPDIDGYKLCQEIRKEHFYPVIMLTARTEDTDKILGLTIGADDYITKPFNPLELVARVKAQLRRYKKYNPSQENVNVIDFKGLIIDNDSHRCTLYDEVLNLTPIEFSILWYLCKNRGRVITSEELFEAVWKEKYFDSNNTVMVHIRRLREKMHEPPRNPKFIKTVWGVGYQIEE